MTEEREEVGRVAAEPPPIKDSGQRRQWATGAVRDRGEMKGAFHLLPYAALERLARHYEGGAKKYVAHNWRLGIPMSEFLNSALRHAHKAADGYRDEDHLAAAAWNLLAAMETERMVADGLLPAELNDVPDFLTREGFAKTCEKIRANANSNAI